MMMKNVFVLSALVVLFGSVQSACGMNKSNDIQFNAAIYKAVDPLLRSAEIMIPTINCQAVLSRYALVQDVDPMPAQFISYNDKDYLVSVIQSEGVSKKNIITAFEIVEIALCKDQSGDPVLECSKFHSPCYAQIQNKLSYAQIQNKLKNSETTSTSEVHNFIVYKQLKMPQNTFLVEDNYDEPTSSTSISFSPLLKKVFMGLSVVIFLGIIARYTDILNKINFIK